MPELKGKKREQPSSRPEGWLAAGMVVPIILTVKQETYARRAVGISRFVYNRMVANSQDARDARLWLTPRELEKEFNQAKRVNPHLAFVTKVSKFVAQGACRSYNNAYQRWRDPRLKARKPVFHKKRRTGTGSFLAASGIARIQYDGNRRVRLPYLGSVKLKRELPEGVHYEVTIRKSNGKWYASVSYWKPPVTPPERETQSIGGVDVGINPLAVDSEEREYPNPKAYYKALKRLRRWQRAQARRRTGSRGWREAQGRVDGLHRRVIGLRSDAHHQVSRGLVRKYHTLGIESLNVAGMINAGLQPKALSDAAMSGLLGKIRYKAEWYGTRVVEADPFYPSSKTCSACGVVNKGLTREPRWTCPSCDTTHDRNINAARNLHKLALGAVGSDVMLPDEMALANGCSVIRETIANEGRTPRPTVVIPPVGSEAAGQASGLKVGGC